MALGLLKIAGNIGDGIRSFIKKRKAKKSERIEKAAAKLEKKKAALAAIGGGETGDLIPALNLKSLDPNFVKISSIAAAEKSQEEGGGNSETAEMAMQQSSKPMPIWLWPVIGIGAILLLPRLLGKKR